MVFITFPNLFSNSNPISGDLWKCIQEVFFHAASSLLEKLDHVQNRFLRELNVSPCQAFLEFNFAPPSLRRNIGALGLLHKRVLGKAHPTFEKLIPWYTERFPEGRSQGHDK